MAMGIVERVQLVINVLLMKLLMALYIRKSAKYNPDFYGIIVPFGTFST